MSLFGNRAGRRFLLAFCLPWVLVPALVAEALYQVQRRTGWPRC